MNSKEIHQRFARLRDWFATLDQRVNKIENVRLREIERRLDQLEKTTKEAE